MEFLKSGPTMDIKMHKHDMAVAGADLIISSAEF